MKPTAWLSLTCVAAALAACGTPETQCRDAIGKMEQRLAALAGSTEPRAAQDQQLQDEARTWVMRAQQQREAGDYAACLESAAEAAERFSRSLRTNQ